MINRIKNLFLGYGIGGIGKSLHLAVSQSFVAVLFILVDFIFSKQLSVSQFGVWKEIFFFLNLGIPLLAFGLPEGYKYFIAKDTNISTYFKNLLGTLLLIGLGVFGVLSVLNGLHFLGYVDLKEYYLISLLFPLPLIAFLLNKALRYSYINLDLAEKLTKLSFYGALISFGVIISGFFILKSHQQWFGLLAITIYFSIFIFPSLFYLKHLQFRNIRPKFNRVEVRQMLTYGFPLYLATFAGLLSGYLDKLIVNILNDDATFAIFAVGAFQIPVFAMLSAAFSQQIFPKMVRLVDQGSEEEAKMLWMSTTKKVSLITYPVILLVMFFAKEIIFFIYSSEYEAAIVLFKTYLLVALFRNNSYGILLTAKGETKIITSISVTILIINLVLSVTLYYYFGLSGVVFGTLFSAFAFTSYVLYKEGMVMSYLNNIIFTKYIGFLSLLILITYFLL